MYLVKTSGTNRAVCFGCDRRKKNCRCVPLSFATLQIGLDTNDQQKESLLRTMESFNDACNRISSLGKMTEFELHAACYYDLRDAGFSSQIAMNAIKRVAAAWRHAETVPEFGRHSSVCFDGRGVKVSREHLSVTTNGGRLKVPLKLSGYHRIRLSQGRLRDGANLCWRKGRFFVAVVVETESPQQSPPKDVLGIDLGIVDLATDSNGKTYSEPKIELVREHFEDLRGRLQSVKTKNSRRHLVRLSGRERRFKRDVNHRISKAIVQSAKSTSSAIAVEDLTGIRERTTVGRAQRSRHAKWTFYEQRKFVEYKALREGVPMVLVNPRNTSRRCPKCLHCSKKNRVSRDLFRCQRCGFEAPADYVGALNIRSKGIEKLGTGAAFNQPVAAQLAAAISLPLGGRS